MGKSAKMNNLMVDIESLGAVPDGVIVQIGACYFDNEGNIGDRFLVNIDIQSSLNLGFKVDKDTLKWWFERSQLITWLSDTVSVHKALRQFREFCYKNKQAELWSHDYDKIMLLTAYKQIGEKFPISYKQFRDLRTLVALSKIKVKKPEGDPKTHNALDDCVYQVGYVCKALKSLKSVRRTYDVSATQRKSSTR